VKRTAPVAPFLRAAPESVVADPWRLAGGVELDGPVEHWDPDLVLRLERRVSVDVDLLLSSTGTGSAAELAVAAVWRSDRTRLKGPGMSVPLPDGAGEGVVTLGVDVPGARAGGRLELQTLVMRSREGPRRNPIAAHRPGSILWGDRVAVALEGEAARFPVTVVDFGGIVGVDADAPWTLEWYPRDLDQPVLGSMQLFVNSRNAAAVDAVGEGERPESGAVASMIRFDVTRSLVHGALTNEEFVARPAEFEADTVGRMLSDLLDRLWPGTDSAALAARLGDAPHRLESELQIRTELLAP